MVLHMQEAKSLYLKMANIQLNQKNTSANKSRGVSLDCLMKKRLMKTFLLLTIIGILILIGFLRCPLRYFFGIPCPFCGMTRAFLSVLQGNFYAAFYYHPLWPVVAIGLVFCTLYNLKIIQLSDKFINYSSFVLGLLFLGCFMIRHLINSPIVQIQK